MDKTPVLDPAEEAILREAQLDLTLKEQTAGIIRNGLDGIASFCPSARFSIIANICNELGYMLTTEEAAACSGFRKKPHARPILYALSDDGVTATPYYLIDWQFDSPNGVPLPKQFLKDKQPQRKRPSYAYHIRKETRHQETKGASHYLGIAEKDQIARPTQSQKCGMHQETIDEIPF